MSKKESNPIKVCIYCRVSTSSQELTQQVDSCKKFCQYKGLEVSEIYKETGSGRNFNRQQFYKMLVAIRNMEYQGVVVFRIDRLGRSVLDLSNFLSEMEHKGVQVFSVSETLDKSSAIGRLTINLIIAMASFERESISEATKQRLNALKERGLKLGRPPGSKDGKKRKRAYFKKPNYGGVL